jgi:hypothetical protein
MTTDYNTTAFAPGTQVVVTDRFGERLGVTDIPAGSRLVVTTCRKTVSSGYQVRVALPGEYAQPDPVVEVEGEFGTDWFERAVGIPFALTKATSQEYAYRSNSRTLDKVHQAVLFTASKGEEVDAVDFRKAVTAALSLAATRAGQSMARREYTKMARHLLYIVDAVIDNALAGLPPVEPGQRSPKIASLEASLEEAKVVERDLRAALTADQDRVAALIREKSALELSVGDLTETLDYAKGLLAELNEVAFGQVCGFEDALAAAIK